MSRHAGFLRDKYIEVFVQIAENTEDDTTQIHALELPGSRVVKNGLIFDIKRLL